MATKKQSKSEVIASLQQIPLNKAKSVFQIKYDDSVLGTLVISKGSIQWYAPNGKKPIRNLTWKRFADMMNKQKGG